MPGLTADQIRTRLADARLYLCTDTRSRTHDLADFVDAALAGGVDVVQIRDKTGGAPLEAGPELRALSAVAELCAAHGALLAVNDRADIAHAANADILHLGQDDLPVPAARRIVGDAMAIGRSTHDLAQAVAAANEPGVDYFCTGPCWPTPTKPGRPAPGLDLVEATAQLGTTRPWFAIGGIDHDRLPRVLAAGASRVVVVRAITEAEDPKEAAELLAAALRGSSG